MKRVLYEKGNQGKITFIVVANEAVILNWKIQIKIFQS